MIQLFLADDHPIVREGLRRVITKHPDMQILGEVGSGVALLEALESAEPDVVLLDITMPGPGFAETLESIKRVKPRTRVLVLSVHNEEQYAVRAFRSGADGYLTKDHSPKVLAEAIRRVHGGGRYISPSLADALIDELARPSSTPLHRALSNREFQVMQRLGRGQSLKEIAGDLGVNPKTVSTYRARVLQKLDLRTTADLIRYAVTNDLVE